MSIWLISRIDCQLHVSLQFVRSFRREFVMAAESAERQKAVQWNWKHAEKESKRRLCNLIVVSLDRKAPDRLNVSSQYRKSALNGFVSLSRSQIGFVCCFSFAALAAEKKTTETWLSQRSVSYSFLRRLVLLNSSKHNTETSLRG